MGARPEMCPNLMGKIDEVTSAILFAGDSKINCWFHRRCTGDYCNVVDVLGKRVPADEERPDRIVIHLEVDGFESCTYKPENDPPSDV